VVSDAFAAVIPGLALVPGLAVITGLALIPEPALEAAVGLGRLTAIATAPRALAAPAPRVMADTHASPLLRAARRAELELGELLMVLQSRIGGLWRLRCSLSMRLRSNTGLCGLWVLPLSFL
jgi:hypothetical protein